MRRLAYLTTLSPGEDGVYSCVMRVALSFPSSPMGRLLMIHLNKVNFDYATLQVVVHAQPVAVPSLIDVSPYLTPGEQSTSAPHL